MVTETETTTKQSADYIFTDIPQANNAPRHMLAITVIIGRAACTIYTTVIYRNRRYIAAGGIRGC